jgi:hypothetical protein
MLTISTIMHISTYLSITILMIKKVREERTGMPDEEHYVGTLLELEDALLRLSRLEAHIMSVAYAHWQDTVEIERERLNGESDRHSQRRPHSGRRAARAGAGESNSERRLSNAE